MKRILLVVCSFIVLICVSCVSNTKPTQKPVNIKKESTDAVQDSAKTQKAEEKTANSTTKTGGTIAFESNLKDILGTIDVIALSENRYFLIAYSTGKGLIIHNLTILDDSGKRLFNYKQEFGESIDQDIHVNNEKLFVSIYKSEGEESKSYVKAIDFSNGTFKDIGKDSMPVEAKRLVWSQSSDNNTNNADSVPSSEIASKIGVKPHESVENEEFGSDSHLSLNQYGDFNVCMRVNTFYGPDAPTVSMDFLGVYKGNSFKKLWTFEKEFYNSDVYADKLVIIEDYQDYNVALFDIETGTIVGKYEKSRYCKVVNDLCFISAQADNGTLIKVIDLEKLVDKNK